MNDAYGKHVLVLGDEPELRVMLGSVVERLGVSIESAPTREDCLKKLGTGCCDLLIVDSNGNAESHLELLSVLKHRHSPVRSLFLVDHGDIATAVRAVKAGAVDCLERPIRRDRLLGSIRSMLGPARPSRLPTDRRLTDIEIEVLHQIAAGKTNKAIGVAMRRSTRTIEVHRRNLMRKLEASGIVDLIKRATALGLIDATGPPPDRTPMH